MPLAAASPAGRCRRRPRCGGARKSATRISGPSDRRTSARPLRSPPGTDATFTADIPSCRFQAEMPPSSPANTNRAGWPSGQHEGRRGVERLAGRGATRDRHDERHDRGLLSLSGAGVERRDVRAVVGHPHRRRRPLGEAPGVDEVGSVSVATPGVSATRFTCVKRLSSLSWWPLPDRPAVLTEALLADVVAAADAADGAATTARPRPAATAATGSCHRAVEMRTMGCSFPPHRPARSDAGRVCTPHARGRLRVQLPAGTVRRPVAVRAPCQRRVRVVPARGRRVIPTTTGGLFLGHQLLEHQLRDRGRRASPSASATPRRSTASTSPPARAPCSACSARTAPARPPPSASSPPCCGRTPARARVAGFDVHATPPPVRGAVGLTGQYASVDEDLTGTQNLVLIGQLLDLPTRQARARAAELLDWFDLTDAAGRTAKTYSGGMRRRLDLAASLVGRPGGDLPGRADHRSRPGQARGDVGRRPPRRRRRLDRAAHHPVPGGGRRARRRDHRHRPRPGHRPRHPGRPQARSSAASGSGPARRPGPAGRRPAILAELTGAAPAETGRARAHRARVDDDSLLPELVSGCARAGIAVHELSLHLPSLDEVFLTLTGRPPADDRRRRRHDHQLATHPTTGPARTLAGRDRHRPPAPRRWLRHALVLARRSLIKTWRTPEALIDVTLQPVDLPGAVHLHLRRRDRRRVAAGLPAVPAARAARPDASPWPASSLGQNLNADIEKGVFDRFRSLPIARSAPLVGAVLADVVRYLILFVVMMSVGPAHGLRRDQRLARRSRRSASRSPSRSASAGSRCSSG